MPATLLLVDDEHAHLMTLEKLFVREGYTVLTASDGQDALELVRAHEINLVITDVMMPKIDGMELLQLIRTLRPEAEVILMTAFGTVELAVQGTEEGLELGQRISLARALRQRRDAHRRGRSRAQHRRYSAGPRPFCC